MSTTPASKRFGCGAKACATSGLLLLTHQRASTQPLSTQYSDSGSVRGPIGRTLPQAEHSFESEAFHFSAEQQYLSVLMKSVQGMCAVHRPLGLPCTTPM